MKVLVFLTIYFLFSLNVVKSFIIFNNENNAKRIQKEIEQKCEGNNCYVKWHSWYLFILKKAQMKTLIHLYALTQIPCIRWHWFHVSEIQAEGKNIFKVRYLERRGGMVLNYVGVFRVPGSEVLSKVCPQNIEIYSKLIFSWAEGWWISKFKSQFYLLRDF